jgi:hypothetical protein
MHPGLELIDRSSYARHRSAREGRLESESGYLELLDSVHARHREQLTREFEGTQRSPLSDPGRALVNACLGEIVAMLRRKAAEPEPDAGALRRVYAILEPKFERGQTLGEAMALDSFHGVLPYFDGAALCYLTRDAPLDGEVREGIRATLQHRFLHGPQRSRHLFLHEMAVGYYLNELESAGERVERCDLRLQPASYAVVPAVFMRALARALRWEEAAFCRLHFCDDERIDSVLPESVQDLMLVAAHLYFYSELRMVYGWKMRNGAVIEHVIKFFALPALDLLAANGFRQRLRDDAGTLIDEAFVARIYGDSTPRPVGNEVDLVLVLHDLAARVWSPP